MIFTLLLSLFLAVLKLTGEVSMSWVIVVSPIIVVQVSEITQRAISIAATIINANCKKDKGSES